MKEIWKNIKEYEDSYQVSNLGRVKSLSRYIQGGIWGLYLRKERILKPGKIKTGYLNVALWKNKKGRQKKIHRLVAQHFIPNPQNKSHVHHKDVNKRNNQINNLQWVTPKENLILHGISKLNDDDVIKIYQMYPSRSYKKIANIFNVHKRTIEHIIKGDFHKYLLKYNPNETTKDFRELRRKFTPDDINFMRNQYPKINMVKLSGIFKTNIGTIWSIIHYKAYKNI